MGTGDSRRNATSAHRDLDRAFHAIEQWRHEVFHDVGLAAKGAREAVIAQVHHRHLVAQAIEVACNVSGFQRGMSLLHDLLAGFGCALEDAGMGRSRFHTLWQVGLAFA